MSQINSILRVKLTRYWESNWLDIESQIDSILRVKLTRYWESNWLDIESQMDSNILQLLGIPVWNLVKSLTQLFKSKWLNFSFSATLKTVASCQAIAQFSLARLKFSFFKVCFACCDPCDSRNAIIVLRLSHGSHQGKQASMWQ